MKISSKGLDMIKACEGWRAAVYADQAGLPTIGYGHLISRDELGLKKPEKETPETLKAWMDAAKVRYPKPLTADEGSALLQKDVERFELGVERLAKVPLNQNQFDALVCFSFNVGMLNLATSTLLKRVNAKADQKAITEAFLMWNKIRDPKTGTMKPLDGLTRRRQKEADLFGA